MNLERGGRRGAPRIETFDQSPGWSGHPELERVRAYALGHLGQKLDLEAGARLAGLHKSTFCTRFRRSIGIGFPEWLARVRVARALDLLERRNMTVAAASRSLGFGTVRTFQRTFKRIAGTTAGDSRPGRPEHSRA